MLEAKIIPIYY